MEKYLQTVNGGQMTAQSLKAGQHTGKTSFGFVNSAINVLILQDFYNDKAAVISNKSLVMSY